MVSSNVRSALVARASQGSAANSSPPSASSLVSTLVPLLIVLAVYLAVFFLFRNRIKRIYQPRTYLGRFRNHERTPGSAPSMFGWIGPFLSLPDTYLLNHHSIDAYLFLRFIKILMVISGFGTLLCWPILMAVDATAPNPTPQMQFGLISMANLDANVTPNRYYAHVLVMYVFLGGVLYILGRETLFFLALRQKYMTSPTYASRLSTRTVLYTDVPEDFLDEQRLRQVFVGVKHVWIATNVEELEELVKDRDQTATKLEGAEIALARNAMKKRAKAIKKAKGGPVEGIDDPKTWLTDKDRPSHKLKFLVGKKVDTIDWCRSHLAEQVPKVEQEQAAHWNGQAKYVGAVFIEFDTVGDAQSALQTQVSHLPKRFQARAFGVAPKEIIWSNLSKPWWRRDLSSQLINIFVTVVIIFWGTIIGFGGLLTNIKSIEAIPAFSWLSFLNAIPPSILGVVTGLLPTIYVAVLMALVPIFLRLFARIRGAVSLGEVELWVQGKFWAFQVVDVFLITTLSSSLSNVITGATSDTSKIPSMLATAIPAASNFYIPYFVTQGLGFAGGALANVVAVALFIILGKLLDNTPRKMFNRYVTVGGLGWGTVYPPLALLGTICLIYSNLAPLVLGFGFCCFGLFYIAFRYNLFYSTDVTGITAYGANYGKALGHLVLGVYISEATMLAIVAIATGSGNAQMTGPLVLMIILFALTIWAHTYFRGIVKPLMETLPKDVAIAAQHQDATALAVTTEGKAIEAGDAKHVNGTNGAAAATSSGIYPVAQDNGIAGRIKRFLFSATTLPEFAPHFAEPVPEYSVDTRREAYLNPAITSPTPFLWIPRDPLGISKREIEETGKIVGISDDQAWFDEQGKIQTAWLGQEKKGEQDLEQQAPVYEKPTLY